MYKLSRYEFEMYKRAAFRLELLTKNHKEELQEAYENVHPTRVHYDFERGELYSESANVEKHAIYIIDLKKEQGKRERYWKERAELYERAVKEAREEQEVLQKLEVLLNATPRLQIKRHNQIKADEVSVDEWDYLVENMSEKDLLADYIDFIGIDG